MNTSMEQRGFSVGDLIIGLVAIAFGAWAGIVGYLGQGIRSDLGELNRTISRTDQRLDEYILNAERRLTILEARLRHLENDLAEKRKNGK